MAEKRRSLSTVIVPDPSPLLDPDRKKERDPTLFEGESLSRAFSGVASVQLS